MLEKVENFVDSRLVLRVFQKVFTYFSPITLIFTTLLTIWIINYNRKRARMVRLIEKIPGPPALPFIGECLGNNFLPSSESKNHNFFQEMQLKSM